jgi:pimeloyl-ACP methyl ester carboxylesterase
MTAPIILVHGLRTSATVWRQQLEHLAERGIPAVAIDLPGHGRRIGERFDLDGALAAIDEAVTDASAPGRRPYLVGESLGGYLAIEWAGRHSHRIGGLLAASCGTVPNRLLLDGWRVLARGIHAFPDRGLGLHTFVVKAFVPAAGAADINAGGVALEVMDDVLRELRPLHPMTSLSRIEKPVLFVNGRLDHFRLHEKRLLAAARDGRLVTIPGANHMVNAVRPEEFTAALVEEYERVQKTLSGGELAS